MFRLFSRFHFFFNPWFAVRALSEQRRSNGRAVPPDSNHGSDKCAALFFSISERPQMDNLKLLSLAGHLTNEDTET